MTRILALDMATNAGWSFNRDSGEVVSGVLHFDHGCPKGGETIRHPHILSAAHRDLSALARDAQPDVVIIEAGFHRGPADKLLQRLIGVAMTVAQDANAAVLSITPGTWRKEIHGSGGLSTDDAKELAKSRTGVSDDNEAEARCILEYAHRVAEIGTAPRRAA